MDSALLIFCLGLIGILTILFVIYMWLAMRRRDETEEEPKIVIPLAHPLCTLSEDVSSQPHSHCSVNGSIAVSPYGQRSSADLRTNSSASLRPTMSTQPFVSPRCDTIQTAMGVSSKKLERDVDIDEVNDHKTDPLHSDSSRVTEFTLPPSAVSTQAEIDSERPLFQ